MKPPEFHIGQAVICVNDIFFNHSRWIKKPRKGAIYHVRYLRRAIGDNAQWAILLAEIHNIPFDDAIERGFYTHRFAPVELLSDAVFTELLNEVLPIQGLI